MLSHLELRLGFHGRFHFFIELFADFESIEDLIIVQYVLITFESWLVLNYWLSDYFSDFNVGLVKLLQFLILKFHQFLTFRGGLRISNIMRSWLSKHLRNTRNAFRMQAYHYTPFGVIVSPFYIISRRSETHHNDSSPFAITAPAWFLVYHLALSLHFSSGRHNFAVLFGWNYTFLSFPLSVSDHHKCKAALIAPCALYLSSDLLP